jgi:ATP-dependent DNA helicase RecG
VGEKLAFAGRVELDYGMKQMKAPFIERLSPSADAGHVGRILPVHRTTDGLTTGWLRRLIAAAVEDSTDIVDPLPASLRLERDLVPLRTAIRDIHFPTRLADAESARHRLAYEEVLRLQVFMAMRRHSLTLERAGIAHRTGGPALAALRASLPFTLTDEQESAIGEILGDMASVHPMNRLLLGDVGTGKTIVAAHALAAAADSGMQAAMMAPTEVLAVQYSEKLRPILEAAGVRCELLTSSTPVPARRSILSGVADGTLHVLFGTHALLQESVAFKRLSLAIVDEQHRFGVGQRLGLRGKGAASDLLVMTATPIPRTLALTIYGDLDTSYLRSKPNAPEGGNVTSTVIPPSRRGYAYDEVRNAVREGRQAYVVCPLVDESDKAEAAAATKEARRLSRQVFPDLKVGLLTGPMRPAEKARAMRDFARGETDVLVATTVVEVGIDVPNATVMLVEDADRFGLAQLHQLRGRIGRGDHPGTFVMLAASKSPEARKRLDALVASSDGFELAEADLALRGEGHILGDRQHGLPALRFANVVTDGDLIQAARDDARDIVDRDPHLHSPEHRPLAADVRQAFSAAWEWVSSG